MTSKPLISVIIPVYNDPEDLEACLKGINNQSSYLSETEVIVVDNASSLSPKKIIDSFSFASYAYEGKPGSYAARNKGMSIAKGEYLVFLDADCIPASDWLDKGIQCLKNNPEHTLIGGEVHLPLSDKPTITELYQCTVGFQQKENIEERLFSVTANLFITMKDALKVGSFDERILSGGDRDWCLKAAKKGMGIAYCPQAIVNTPPRKSLGKAIVQARRVAGGRFQSEALKLNENPNIDNTFKSRRSNLQSILWVFQQSHLTYLQRFQIFFIATLLKVVGMMEYQRLKLGLKAERS